MERPLSVNLLLPRAGRHSAPFPVATTAPLTSGRPKCATAVLPPGRRRRLYARLSASAAATETTPLSTEDAPSTSPPGEEGSFDWLDQWYPIAPVCDLDPRAPHGKTVLGLSVVAWYGRAAGEWRVFDDACPHRLAPLSEGRIDDKGRLQCVYHGWCFDGAGACKFIPQASALGPQSKKTTPRILLVMFCVPVAPGRSRVVWAFPRNVGVWLHKITPRWLYHVGQNLILDSDIFLLHVEERKFAAAGLDNWQKVCYVPTSSDNMVIAFRNWFRKFCKNRIGWATPQVDQLPPTPTKDQLMERYWSHVAQCTSCKAALKAMKALEVALQVASVAVVGFLAIANGTAERKFDVAGLDNWQKVCYVPTSSDNMVIAFRNWFNKFCKNRIGWATPQSDQLPPTPTKDQLMERYWSHVAQCTSCSTALKAMKALEVALQITSVAVIGFFAVANGTVVMSALQRATVVATAVVLRRVPMAGELY
ncbi:hypothetical protein HU200_029869 [Digitaria exilis]|uniref:Rieske domain-containing protein n=1 Tax=Digitaria exilis TaxID=1010633 RepID=A0A835BRS4_9POAL|nr:hypothetical protein HU200_029869 [Digitaria exilis]